MTRDDLTILVPTYNRYPLLRRLAMYYQACGAPYPMRVLDSSDDDPDRSAVVALLRRLQIEHVAFSPDTLPTAKLEAGVDAVTTPYVVLWADDDLLVPRMLGAAVDYLQQHADCSIAHGSGGVFQVATRSDRPVLTDVGAYRQFAYTQPRASERLRDFLGHYTTLFYSVHRTSNLQHNFAQCRACGFGFVRPDQTDQRIHRSDMWVEVLTGCLSVTQGRVAQLPGLYMMRQRHPGADSWEESGRTCDVFDWVTSASFAGAYAQFAACLVQPLRRADRLSESAAAAVVKEAFWHYLSRCVSLKWRGRYAPAGPTPAQHWRQRVAAGLPGLRRAWRLARARWPGQAWSPEALCHPASPYYADFRPIYQAITGHGYAA